MKRDQFFFPSVGNKYWSAQHQALLAAHRQASYQPPEFLYPMPDFSNSNDLSMPPIDWGVRHDPVRVKPKPLSEEERRKVWRGILILGVVLLFIRPLAPFGVAMVMICAAAGAMRLLGRFLSSGLLEEWLGRLVRFAWASAVGVVLWMVDRVEDVRAARRQPEVIVKPVFAYPAFAKAPSTSSR